MIKKLCIVGWGRSGKDEAGMTLGRLTSLRYGGSTSWAALPHMSELLGVHPQVAWETRHQNRDFWYRECNEFRKDDAARLIRLVLEQGDMVIGVRDHVEFEAGRREGLWDYSLWIDRPGIPVDPTVTFGMSAVDEVFVNDYPTVEHYRAALLFWAITKSIPLKLCPEIDELLSIPPRARST